MKKLMIIVSFVCVLLAGPVNGAGYSMDNSSMGGYDREDNTEAANPGAAVPPGMETVKRGDVNLVVYKGDKSRKENDVMITENGDDYASRKFSDSDERLNRIEKELEAQKKDIEDIKGMLSKPGEDGRNK